MRRSKNGLRRVAALICSAALVVTLLPAQVLATDEVPEAPEITQNEPGPEETGDDFAEKDQTTVVDSEKEPETAGQDVPPEGQDPETNGDIQKEEEAGETEENPANPDGNTPDANKESEDTQDESSQQDGTNPSVNSGEKAPAGPSKVKQNTLEVPIDTQETNAVAQIGEKQYNTLDAAVADAEDGATIELLQDATTSGLNIRKNLTIQAAAGLEGKPTITFQKYGIAIGYAVNKQTNFTLKNVDVVMKDIGITPITGEWNWQSICAHKATFTLDNVKMNMDGENAIGAFNNDTQQYKTVHAIYLTEDCTLNLLNGTNLTIQHYDEDALEWDGGKSTYKVNIINSTYISDDNRSGFTGTFLATIDNSTVKVLNSAGNGSNGTYYAIQNNSNVLFDNNGSWGISAYQINMTGNSTLTATNNAYSGVWVRILNVDNTCTLDVERNGYEGDWDLDQVKELSISATSSAGITFWGNGSNKSDIASGAQVTIKDNAGSGIAGLQGASNITIGSATIVNNGANYKNLGEMYGGGIFTVGTIKLSSDVVINNNHATTAGDDICYMPNRTTRTLEFGQVGSDWLLDDCAGLENCDAKDTAEAKGKINGWYDDSVNARWNAHDGDGIFHVVEFTNFDQDTGLATLSGSTDWVCLKAAHDAVTVVRPADITIYMGGDGYEGVIKDESGETLEGSEQTDSGLPEPGFYITLPDDINTALQNEGITADGESANLSDYLHIYTTSGTRTWSLKPYGKVHSGAYGHYIYRIVPTMEGQDPVRLEFKEPGENGKIHISDDFRPDAAGSLFQEYDMSIYAGGVNLDQVRIDVTIPGKDGAENTVYTCTMKSKSGSLKVRYVTGDQDSVVTTVEDSIVDVQQEEGKAYAVAEAGTQYYVNGSEVDVTDAAVPSLLFDDVVDNKDTGENEDYSTQLKDYALNQIGTNLQNPSYQAKYLDLVDAGNGNVWLTSDKPVTVYWPYPEGTNQSTKFYLVHFEGLDREMENDQIESAIEYAVQNGKVDAVTILKQDQYGISFQASSFSPFVLLWDNPVEPDQPADEGDTEQPTQTPAPTAAPTPAPTAVPTPAPTAAPAVIPQTGDTLPVGLLGGVAVVAVAAFVVLLVLRKRKHDD